jgi:hypothetical protein
VVASPQPGRFFFNGIADHNTPIGLFRPILLDIPAGTISDNEAWEPAINLQSDRDDATPGQVSLLRGEQFKADSIQVGDSPTTISGRGATEGSASLGSIYLCRDGVPDPSFYIYEKRDWKAKF